MKLTDVQAGYNRKIVVGGVSLEIGQGEIITLIGPNGGGKSTLIKTISGALSLIGGTVTIGEQDITSLSAKEISKTMSVVTTERVKPQLMTCRDVVLSGRLPFTGGFGLFGAADQEETDKALELMNIRHLADRPFSDMSDGQKQRTLIARAICQSPKYLVMDEPTSYMDIKHRLELMKVLKKLTESGITIVMSLHELELALEVSDRLLLVYDDGHVKVETPTSVIADGLLKGLFDLDDEMYRKVLSGLGHDGGRHSGYFVNRACEFYPCHDVPDDKFSCMFCYCPLFDVEDCGGEYFMTDKGVKNCRNCTFVHYRDNYTNVIKKLKEKMYGTD
ncbi:ATP-binding cassette domain-containing protein [Butyrivibrio sp. CB08]|uniref:ATP-binding cassette domain-containing protein n=1 Tax=Butyrivibrio sp. CB08 TaxID=2364879 RepID=UPI000EA9A349|nr:ATP-binding cassette domain-containing protein [Butyrivibrio sp. CB08]RKM59758.1 ATP-binding cassette domain-containing protein [Butyrivibrio sp. CB08]